ncbi:MAG: ribonuclease H-like domain-containing protein [Syntrophales bacterium]
MGTKDRLERLTGEKKIESGSACPGNGARVEEIRALRERIDAVLSRRPEGRTAETPTAGRGRGVPLEELVSGAEAANEAGRFFCSRRVAGGSSRHGRFCIRDLAPLDMGRIAVLANDPDLRGFDYRQAFFLDTETTGLAGGTGTVAFLIGIGWFEGEAFVTEQLFARDYAEERATLLHLRELLREGRFLVSFNGKAFDANLLAARFIMNRLPDPLAGLPHLDLLHSARRLLSHRLSDRRLGALEGAILGFEREGDIPGSEIPQRYFDWLRRRDGRLMADVFEHNRLDILSLAALAAHLTELIDPAGEDARRHPGDRLAAARLFLARDRNGDAVRLLDPLLGCASPDTAREAARELSLLHKRQDRWPAAAAIWEEMVRRDGEDLFALVELAKWQEHRRRDLAEALALTMRACAGRLTPEERAALVRRRERLERKLAGRNAAP